MWAIYAIFAAIFWGIDYALTEKLLLKIRFPTLLSVELLFGFLVMLCVAIYSGTFKTDMTGLFSSNKALILLIGIIVAFNIANVFIVLSIGHKNATVSGLIEISYPLFIALFSWLFFHESNLGVGSIAGGIFILAGVLMICLYN